MTTRDDTARARPLAETHDGFRYFGPKQGAQCRCGAWFYPVSGAAADQHAEWRLHVWQATGEWPKS